MSHEWISRKIAKFGRIRAPPGLIVTDGCLRLSNLMEVWGYAEGLREHQVVKAVSVHLMNLDTHNDTGGMPKLRFGIVSDVEDIIFKVMPSRSRLAEGRARFASEMVAADANDSVGDPEHRPKPRLTPRPRPSVAPELEAERVLAFAAALASGVSEGL